MTKQALRYNHLGYAPFAPKKFLVVETSFTSFEIKNEYEEVVFQGKLEPKGIWSFTEESCFLGDFSAFQKKGSTALSYLMIYKAIGFSSKTSGCAVN